MKDINRETIYNLPFHDSNFLGMKISQNDNGDTDLILNIAFCKGEFEDLADYSNVISPEGCVSIVFAGCELININTFCNGAKRDAIDYIEFNKDTSLSEKNNIRKDKGCIEVVFVSGSTIDCIANKVQLSQVIVM